MGLAVLPVEDGGVLIEVVAVGISGFNKGVLAIHGVALVVVHLEPGGGMAVVVGARRRSLVVHPAHEPAALRHIGCGGTGGHRALTRAGGEEHRGG